MSILIKGMEMPKSCHFCELYEADMYWCSAAKRDIENFDDYENRSSFCPLVPVPPHGRCIDADEFESIKYELPNGQKAFNRGFHSGVQYVQRLIMDAPTIIPAEEGET